MMGNEEPDLQESREEMESLVLDEPSNGRDDPLMSSSSSFMDRQTLNSSSSFNAFLDPPSYAEAIFTSFDSSSNGHESPGLSSNSNSNGSSNNNNNNNPRSADYLYISVSDPQKEQELSNSIVPGGTTYYTYLITTRTNLPEFGGPGSEFSVRRRFKDVVTLSDRLSESYRGFFIPLRPDKSVVESQVMAKQEFVEQRRLSLEKYLRRLAMHPAICRSEELRLFLEVKGKLPLALVKSGDTAAAAAAVARQSRQLLDVNEVAKGGMELFRLFKELKQSVTNDWGGVKPLVVEEDKEFVERKERLMGFEKELSNVSLQAESLVRAQQDMGETMGELGLAFVKMAKFETEEALFDSQRTRATGMKNVATASVKASRLYRELTAQTVKHLDKLHDYLGTMLAVNNAFSDRSSALLTVQTLSSELVSLHSRIEKLEAASSKIFGGDRSRMRKIEELKETVRVTEDAKTCADREYEQIKENNRNELGRLDKEKHDDFMSMLRGFVVNQAGYAEKMASVWGKLAEETSAYAKDSTAESTWL